MPPSSYTSSVASNVTGDSLKKCTEEIEAQMDKLVTATADVVVAIKNVGSGRWPKRPDLTEENLKATLEGHQDTVEDLKQKSETKQIALEQVASLEEEIHPPEQGGDEERQTTADEKAIPPPGEKWGSRRRDAHHGELPFPGKEL